MIYVKIRLNCGASYIQPQEEMDVLLDEIGEAILNEDYDCVWEVSLIEMSEDEYAKLPEFTGH